jgi:hypothetical protein
MNAYYDYPAFETPSLFDTPAEIKAFDIAFSQVQAQVKRKVPTKTKTKTKGRR